MADEYFERRAKEIRKIAEGIFDHRERAIVLEFVADLEKLVVKPGLGKGKSLPQEIAND